MDQRLQYDDEMKSIMMKIKKLSFLRNISIFFSKREKLNVWNFRPNRLLIAVCDKVDRRIETLFFGAFSVQILYVLQTLHKQLNWRNPLANVMRCISLSN